MWSGFSAKAGTRLFVLWALLFGSAFAVSAKNLAVVTPAASRVDSVTLAELAKLAKGTTKTWPDGKNFTLVLKDPDSDDMRVVVQKLFGMSSAELRQLAAKLNDSQPGHSYIRFVSSDAEVLQAVQGNPGAVGIVDVYSITSAVKVIRVDGKLPFDPGYVFKAN
ncbi:MAG TPA: hypothetical protein VEU31_11625 [Candidatus Acidoferrales bacterium]|nr:hypothetical protein [Candidatus Acidoferrales bacterium]